MYLFTDESSTHNYLDDSDFDEAFQNLLCPIEFITKRNPCEFMQYNYLKVIMCCAIGIKNYNNYSYVGFRTWIHI